MEVPSFGPDGLLPAGDYEVSFEELRGSILVRGPSGRDESSTWDAGWRMQLVRNLEILCRQLWRAGVTEIFVDGSFVEDKDHPNDIDGYFVCSLNDLKNGRLERRLNLLDPHRVWTWDPASRMPFRGYPKKQLPMWHQYRGGALSARAGAWNWQRDKRQARARTRASLGLQTIAAGWQAARHCEDPIWRCSMIRSETEYREAVKRLEAEKERLKAHRTRLKKTGLASEEIRRVMDPMESFHLQMKEEVESYEKLRRGEFEELDNLRGLGALLVGLRIARGMSQRELAKRLGVHESQVSRDERNDYFGMTLERAAKVLEALGFSLKTRVSRTRKGREAIGV